jgi:biopolymer transport protein ExbB
VDLPAFLERVVARTLLLPGEAAAIWLSGGWAMIAIAVIALVIFTLGMSIRMRLARRGFQKVPERTWRRWVDHPAERRGPIGRMIAFVTGGVSLEETSVFFDELRQVEVAPFERDLRVMKICVSAAPLVGLLGKVTGMLATFEALSTGSGGDKTMALVAKGISEALITTETGLVVALLGLFFQYHLKRRFERYRAFLAHLETVCAQSQYAGHRRRRDGLERRVARETVLRMLHERLARRPAGDASAARAARSPGHGVGAADLTGLRPAPAAAGRNG